MNRFMKVAEISTAAIGVVCAMTGSWGAAQYFAGMAIYFAFTRRV